MLHSQGSIGCQGDFLLESILVLGQCLGLLGIVLGGFLCLGGFVGLGLVGRFLFVLGVFLFRLLGRCFLEAVVDLLEEWRMVVERLQIQGAVDVDVAVVGDDVAQRGSVFQIRTTYPGVGGVVGSVAVEPVEDGQLVERQLIGGGKRLPIVQGDAPVQDALLDRVFPGGIAFGVQVLVHRRIGFLNLCPGGTLEVGVQVLGQVPAQLEITVPEELFVERQGQVGVLGVLEVAFLQFIVIAGHLGVEGNGLRQIIET